MPRKANNGDFGAICSLMSRYIIPPWTEAQTRATLSSDCTDAFVCEENGETVGYAIVENVLDEGCLTSIAVREDKRGKGFGKKLLEFALKESKAASVYLEVMKTNEPAIALYNSCGFEKIGERKKYYGDISAVIMRRELSDKS